MKNKSLLIAIAFLIIAINTVAQVKDTFTDARDGKIYKTVKIGTQTWMAENLAYKANYGCWAYNNDTANVAKYGYMYNWGVAKDVCPAGWHLPSDIEWTILTDYLGGSNVAGGKLKSTMIWKSSNTKTNNSSGFSALPGGNQANDGTFINIGSSGNWWSSTEDDMGNPWFRSIDNNNSVARFTMVEVVPANFVFSIRCVKDK